MTDRPTDYKPPESREGLLRRYAGGEAKSGSDDFVGATFGGKWKLPRVGSDLLLTIDYEIQ